MVQDLGSQLQSIADGLSLSTTVAGPVEPGQVVNLSVVSDTPAMEALGIETLELPVSPLDGTTTQVELPVAAPVRLSATWHVRPGHRGPFSPEVALQAKPLRPGKDYLAPGGLTSTDLTLLLRPPVVNLGASAETAKVTVVVDVTVDCPAFNVPPVTRQLSLPLELLPVELPTMAVLFRHKDFAPLQRNLDDPGYALVVLPAGSPLREVTGMLMETLADLELVLARLRGLASFAAMLAGLRVLRHALSAQPMARTWHSPIRNLTSIHMNVETRFGVDILNRNLRAHDRASSLIVIGLPGTTVECFNDERFATGEGAFTITCDTSMHVLVRDLHAATPAAEPPATLRVVVPDNDANKFGDSMSSIRLTAGANVTIGTPTRDDLLVET